jgi:uncharacterized protein (DUF433 family)
VEIGSLITHTPGVKGGRPLIKGTGIPVKRIAACHRMGMDAGEIVAQYSNLNLAQVHAALAYCYANAEAVAKDLSEEEAAYDQLAEQSRKSCAA